MWDLANRKLIQVSEYITKSGTTTTTKAVQSDKDEEDVELLSATYDSRPKTASSHVSA